MFNLISIMFLVAGFSVMTNSQTKDQFQNDEFQLDKGILKITFIGHGSLMFDYNGMIVQVDPWSKLADYSKFPKADIILITHEHGDHFDPVAIKASEKKNTRIVCTQRVADSLKDVETVMKNGDFLTIDGVEIVAVPAYNLLHKRPNGEFYHPKGVGNGYVIRFGNKKVYIAGDTENIPEMKNLK